MYIDDSQAPKEESHDSRDERLKGSAHFVKYAIASVVILVLLLFLIGIVPKLISQNELAQTTIQNTTKTATPKVMVMELKAVSEASPLVLPSTVEALHMTPIWSRVNGYLKAFYHDIGDHVKAGDLLAEIETPELDEQYAQTLADVRVSTAKVAIAEITAGRWIELHKEDPLAIAKQDVDQKVADLEAAKAQEEAAKANADRYKAMLKFKNITAPFDGIITRRTIDIGSLITAGSANNPQQLFKIAKTDILRIFVQVPQRYFRAIQKGVHAQVTISEYPDKVFDGQVVRYAKALDPVARTLLTEIHIDNKSGELYTGLYAEVKFLLPPSEPYFLIPTSALLIRSEGPHVALVDHESKVEIRKVKLGLDHGKTMEIIAGLKEGEKLITILSDKIAQGVKVEVLPSK